MAEVTVAYSKKLQGWGLHSTKVAYLVYTQLPWVQFYSFPISHNFRGTIIDVSEVNPLALVRGKWTVV